MILSLDQFKAITQSGPRAVWWHAPLDEGMGRFKINDARRICMFLANVAHESEALVYSREIWGPTRTQSLYEGRKDLGNTQPGDGRRYLGRGPIQVTGRANYTAATKHLSQFYTDTPDFEAKPEQLETPLWGSRAACEFWSRNGINAFADTHDFDGACDAVNRGRKTAAIGDSNGYAKRLAYYSNACKVLGITP